jgi:hypothetical protein
VLVNEAPPPSVARAVWLVAAVLAMVLLVLYVSGV